MRKVSIGVLIALSGLLIGSVAAFTVAQTAFAASVTTTSSSSSTDSGTGSASGSRAEGTVAAGGSAGTAGTNPVRNAGGATADCEFTSAENGGCSSAG